MIYKLGNSGINIYFAYFPICGEVVDWGDSGSHTGFRTALFGGFSCDFSVMDRFMRRTK